MRRLGDLFRAFAASPLPQPLLAYCLAALAALAATLSSRELLTPAAARVQSDFHQAPSSVRTAIILIGYLAFLFLKKMTEKNEKIKNKN